MKDLNLKKVKAYTIYSQDDDIRSSNKGVYKDCNIASLKAVGAGWYGSNGIVKDLENIYEDENGELYEVIKKGKFTDTEEKFREDTILNIKKKLTKSELDLLGIS